ncbi:MAG: SDR family oxidoreductase [Acidimicrobiales bacterium]|nr:SDR family oxidoreductase [Acidimicrobiales bacterium]
MKLQWKVAVVTGAASGIGAHSARLFAEEGAMVVCVDRDHHGVHGVANEITAAGGRAKALTADVSSEEEVRAMIDTTVEDFGRLDVLFNNAGVMLPGDGDAETTDMDVWDTTFDINVKGVWLGCKYGIPAMRDAGGGSIINTASFVAVMGAATAQLAYTASKGAVLSLTRELSVVHARENIRVNALCPGPLDTKLLMDALDTEEKKQRRLVHVPMGRFGDAEEMAKAALFLATDDSSYMTGSTFLVDGGLSSAYVTPE